MLADYSPTIAFAAQLGNWHPMVEIDGEHLDLPQPALVAHQSEFTFCSTLCMRRWLNAAMDLLDEPEGAGTWAQRAGGRFRGQRKA